ncbi:11019_t:CDS:2, partial [Scutellospora calospora]
MPREKSVNLIDHRVQSNTKAYCSSEYGFSKISKLSLSNIQDCHKDSLKRFL